jgi:hypothetical protein
MASPLFYKRGTKVRSNLPFILCTHAATKIVAIASLVTTRDQSEMEEAMTNATQK